MNFFQKIREVKLPFLAVIGALVFGGIVAPANAAAPVPSAFSYSYSSTTTGSLTFTTNADGVCGVVVRLNSSQPITNTPNNRAYVADVTTAGSDDAFVASVVVTSGVARSVNLTGLMNQSPYTAYVVCRDAQQDLSGLFSYVFTHQLGGGGGGSSLAACSTVNNLSQVRFSRSTLTPTDTYTIYPGAGNEIDCGINAANAGTRIEIDGQLARAPFFSPNVTFNYFNSPRAYSSITANNTNNVPIVDGSVYTLKYYVGLSGLPTASDTPVRVVSLVLYPSGNAPSSTPTTAAVQRPLPQINFAANPVNGVSARPTADTRKGTLTIEGSNLSDLTSITIGGKAATFTVKDGKLDIKLPAGVTGFPEVVMTNASGSITMQNAIEIYAPTVQKLTRFVGDRLTLAGMETLENLYINNKTATALEATVVVAPDATEAEIAKAVKAATKAVTYIDKVGKRIVRTAVTVSKTGEAGTKPSIEMSFTK